MSLSLEAVGLSWGSALKSLSLSLQPGVVLGIVGPNGAGKTTLLRCLAGDLRPDFGSVRLGERSLAQYTPSERARQLAYLPQTTPIVFAFTVEELVGLGAHSREAVQEVLELMDLTAFTKRSLLSLSGGERQRAALARVLAQRTPYLILDEPLAHLDPLYQQRLLETLRRHCQSGGAALLALHELRLAQQWCNEVAVLQAGELQAIGEPQQVLTAERLKSVFGVEPGFIS